MRENLLAEVRDDAFAERGDEVKSQRARDREHEDHPDHYTEVVVDQRAFAGKAVVDHAANRDRNRERGEGRQQQRAAGEQSAQAVAQKIGNQEPERLQGRALSRPGLSGR